MCHPMVDNYTFIARISEVQLTADTKGTWTICTQRLTFEDNYIILLVH